MADPISAAAAGGGLLQVAGGAVSAYGDIQGGKAQQAMYNYKAGVAKMNAQVAENQANLDLAEGGLKETEQGLQGRSIIARTRTAFGAGNINPDTGSAAQIKGSELEIGKTNEDVALFDAQHAAYNEQIKAATSTAEAGADVAAGTTSAEAGKVSAIASVLGSAGSVASKWTQSSAYAPSSGQDLAAESSAAYNG